MADKQFEEYKEKLDKLNLKTSEDLENLVKPLIKNATRIIVKKQPEIPKNSHLKSHFGGQPYFENGEEWPKARDDFRNNCDLEFVFQIFNDGSIVLPENIKLVQFFYDLEGELSFDTSDGGWFVKIYENLNMENMVIVEKPSEHTAVKYCEIEFEPKKSLPDWQEIGTYDENIEMLSCVLDEENPWNNYQRIVEKLIGEQDIKSQLGGYAQWIQGDNNPEDKRIQLLFQIDSEDDAGLMWGDVGLIYVFYNNRNKSIEYVLQCC